MKKEQEQRNDPSFQRIRHLKHSNFVHVANEQIILQKNAGVVLMTIPPRSSFFVSSHNCLTLRLVKTSRFCFSRIIECLVFAFETVGSSSSILKVLVRSIPTNMQSAALLPTLSILLASSQHHFNSQLRK